MPEIQTPIAESQTTDTVNESTVDKDESEIVHEEPKVIDVAERRGEGVAIKILITLLTILLIVSAIAFGGYIFLNSDSKILKFLEDFSISDLLGPTTPKAEEPPQMQPPTADKDSFAQMVLLATKSETMALAPEKSSAIVKVELEPKEEITTEEIAKKAMPSVVGIESYDDDNSLKGVGIGSGIIMSEDGYIITNAHVILEDDEITAQKNFKVHLFDDTVCDGVLVGADRKTDLAVLKVDKTGLTAASFGNSDEIAVGSKAVAIGNPTGLQLSGSLTQGVISGINRKVNVGFTGEIIPCIQTDAPINPGNSGGALINKSGQVIGVNTIKVAATVYEGLGFAIPINVAKPIVDEIIQNGSIKSRPRLGITIMTVPKEFADKVKITDGVRVLSIDEESDASEVGLQKGDIITAVDAIKVTNNEGFINYVRTKNIGDKIKLTVTTMKADKETFIEIEVRVIADNSGDVEK